MNDLPLPRSTVLHAILTAFEPHLSKVFPSQKELGDFLKKLTKTKAGLSPAMVSRWLFASQPIEDAAITEILDDENYANAVVDACNIPRSVFDAATLAQAKSIVASHFSEGVVAPLSHGGCWFVDRHSLPEKLPDFCSTEESIITDLSAAAGKVRKHVLVNEAPFDAGISFLWYLTAVHKLIPERAEAVFLLRPEIRVSESAKISQSFEAAIAWLATKLGLSPKSDVRTIVEKIIASRTIVVFLSFSGPFDGLAQAIVSYALVATKRKDDPPAVIVSIPQHGKQSPMKLPLKESSIDVDDLNIVDMRERYPFFRSIWQQYCVLRKTYRPDEGGSRLKRARWHYSFVGGERLVYPINIRLRAFFASDLTNFSYFDPTAGFDRLCNMRDQPLPVEIEMYHDDIQRWVQIWDATKKSPPLRPLKWCSTAIYWLTQDAVKDLGTKFPFVDLADADERGIELLPNLPLKPSPTPEVDPDTFREAAKALPAILWYEPEREQLRAKTDHYVAAIGIKAIVQDHWLRTDPAARSHAHFTIAERLYDKQHKKDALGEEFPFTPHWGRSGIFFLAECIRHLMRAIAPVVKAKPSRQISWKEGEFVSPPSRSMLGCDPYEVLSFCFGQVYWKEIDGNSDEIDARKLSQRHGLYHLSAELLQLMSNNEVLGEPHWALDRKLHGKYYASAAFAQFELGNLKGAEELFEKRLAYVRETDVGSLAELTAELDLIAVKIELQQLDGLEEKIEDIDERVKANPIDGSSLAAEQVSLHCTTLRGQIRYARKEFDAAVDMLKKPHDEMKDDRLSIEASHYLVASKGAKAEELSRKLDRTPGEEKEIVDLRDEALMVASRKLWHYASEGEQHVALGFRISSAHLFRNMGKYRLAETWMNSVYIDILRYGCSERTYLSFLREAGRIVRATERPARAYAVYLKPAAIRAASRGHVRAARVAFEEAIKALFEARTAIERLGPDWEAQLAIELQEPKELSEEADAEIHDFVPADPLFSFDLLGRDQWSVRLLTTEALEKEREAFTEEFSRLQPH
ncbi:hypothetical protein [Bradyrhizobium mercantei]|uniref:hypothetical protein n=1 Tax=Bradyrhizobium mercantei TaxID=1904807 RepID=UPI000978596E|nr:hypothetical protein [Bradyrhizobium mercantei]